MSNLIEREGNAIDLVTIDPDAGEANDQGVLLRYSDTDNQWVYNLSTKNLVSGTYSITIKTPDGKRFIGGFVLR